MRLTSAGGMTRLHLGHTASSDARTFSRLIFRELGMGWAILVPRTTASCKTGKEGYSWAASVRGAPESRFGGTEESWGPPFVKYPWGSEIQKPHYH